MITASIPEAGVIEETTTLLDQLIADVICREEAGDAVDRRALFDQHPDLADDLRAFFSDRDEMQRLAEPISSDPPLPLPDTIRYVGDYELLEEIARGGMGVVYRARQKSLNRTVAVKMVAAGHLATEEDLKRFRTEAEAAGNLQHPHIVSVHEVGVHDGRHYFSMDYIEGRNLSEVIREQPLPAVKAARYVRDIARAVHFAHQQGTLHRDLKPSNVLIDENDQVHVTDFGLAMRVEGDSGLTQTGQVLGTPSYMSPEQSQGKRGLIGPAGDVYSLGVILYELLTGRPPFRAESAVETIRQVVEREPASPRLLNASVPRDLETICLKCLAKEPHERYPAAELLADDLERFATGQPILARPVGRIAKLWKCCRRNPAVAALSTALALVFFVGFTGMTALWLEAQKSADDAQKSAEQAQQRAGELAAVNVNLADANADIKSHEKEVLELLARITGLEGNIEELIPMSLEALGHKDARVRRKAVDVLRAMDPRDAELAAKLIPFLNHRDAYVQGSVAEMLIDMGDLAVGPLTKTLDDKDTGLRIRAVDLLGHLGTGAKPAVGRLKQLLSSEDDFALRWTARESLIRIVPGQTKELRGDRYDAVAAQARWMATQKVRPNDCPQRGGSPSRNATPAAKNIPTDWKVVSRKRDSRKSRWIRRNGKYTLNPDWKPQSAVPDGSKNVKWSADIGSQTWGTPAVANGKVFIGANNGSGYLKRYPPHVDLGVLLCFEEETGKFLWQYSSHKLESGRINDWPMQGMPSTPYVDGDRLWVVTNRCELVCLDTEGFRDGDNDGPFTGEERESLDEADVIWKLDMMKELTVFPHNMTCSSVTGADGVLFVSTANGVDETHVKVPSPRAPNLIAVDRKSGKVLWQDNTAFDYILHGSWASPSYGVFKGQPQVIFPAGDGWLYAFDPKGDGKGNPKLLWKFDCNPKDAKWESSGRGTRNAIIGFAAIYDGRVFICTGQDPEHGGGAGHLWCIDPTKRGDVSPTLVVDKNGKTIDLHANLTVRNGLKWTREMEEGAPSRKSIAVHIDRGEKVVKNPNSAMIWHFGGPKPGEKREHLLHRSLATPVIKDDLLYIPDTFGELHCINAKSGEHLWKYDLLASCWNSALVVGDKVYVADEDGDVAIFRHSPDPSIAMINGEPVVEIMMENSIYSMPVVANNVLFFTTRHKLYAIAAAKKKTPVEK